MTARAYNRGHKIKFIPCRGWIYSDDFSSITVERPCKKCGRLPTIEGYDACLGFIEGVSSACCGHGVKEGFVKF